MNDEQSFLDAIATEPDDDTARLVYADWLEDRDFPDRADAIRRGVKNPKRFTFGEGTVARVSYTGSRRDLPQIVCVTMATGYAGVQWTTYKGLIESATCTWEWWLAAGDVLLRYNWCPEVVLTTVPDVSHGSSHAIIPGRQKAYPIDPTAGPILTVLKNEWRAVKRWAMPEQLRLVEPDRDPRATSYRPAEPPLPGETVTLLDGAKAVLLSGVDINGRGVVRRIPGVRA